MINYNPKTDIVVSYNLEITESHSNNPAFKVYCQLASKHFQDYYKGDTINCIIEKEYIDFKDQKLRFQEGFKTDNEKITYNEIKDKSAICGYIGFHLKELVKQKISLRKVDPTISGENNIKALHNYAKTYIEGIGADKFVKSDDIEKVFDDTKSYFHNRKLIFYIDNGSTIKPLTNEQTAEFISQAYQQQYNILLHQQQSHGRGVS